MIDLLPVPQDRFHCPCGAAELVVDGFSLPGMMPLARARCPACGRRFACHLHVGFCSSATLMVEEASGEIANSMAPDWYAWELQQMWQSRGRPSPAVEIRGEPIAAGRDVVIVNTLDPTYGHNIARMFAVPSVRRFNPDAAIVVIASRFMAWLTPECADQIWVVDAPLRELHLANDTVDAMAAELARRAARLRYSPLFYSLAVRIEDFTKINPFDATSMDDVLPARMAFNWREDRCWTQAGRPLPPDQAVAEQLRLTTLLFETLRREISDLEVTVTGYGRSGIFPGWVEDLRILEQTDEAEREWVRRYARSHLVMGMHGSHMHLPSAHAAGGIEIVPTAYWATSAETWEWVNHNSAQHALQRYLKIAHSTSVSDVVSIAFMQLRRMQAGAAFRVMSRLPDAQARERLAVLAHQAIQGGYPLQVTDKDGNPI